MSVIGLDRPENRASVSGPPTTWDYFADRAFRALAHLVIAITAEHQLVLVTREEITGVRLVARE